MSAKTKGFPEWGAADGADSLDAEVRGVASCLADEKDPAVESPLRSDSGGGSEPVRAELDEHAAERVGSVLKEKYRLVRLIGVGGMAAVYEGQHRNANRVAIKMLHPHLCIDRDLKARFLREGYVANTVDHRGAVRVLDDETAEDGSVFLVMELLEGETLDARWKRANHRLPPREVCELMYQLLDVLAAAHAKGIVHRDIKPENLFVTREGVLKVLDFGIARLRDGSAKEGATKTGRMIGTPAFMPPEQALGRSREIDGQTDVWAVGATMFALLSGSFVHDADTMEAMLVYAGSRPARALGSVVQVAPAIGAVVDKALAFDRAKRWGGAREMEMALEEAYVTTFGARMPGSRGSRPSMDPAAFAETAASGPVARAPSAGPVSAALAPTMHATEYAAPQLAPLTATVDNTELMATPYSAASARGRGISTTAGVASGAGVPSATPAPVQKKRSAAWPIAIGVLGLVGVGGAVAAVKFVGGAASKSAGPAQSVSATAPPPATSTATPAPQPEMPAAVVTASARVEDAAAPTGTKPGPAGAPSFGRPRAIAAASAPAAPASASPPATTAAPPKGPNCDVPFYIDSQGIQRVRPECK